MSKNNFNSSKYTLIAKKNYELIKRSKIKKKKKSIIVKGKALNQFYNISIH